MKSKILKELNTLKLEGITKRWLINIIGLIFLFLVIVFIVASVSIKSYYYNSVESILNSGASANAANYFSTNLDSGTSLESSAARFVEK